MFFDEKIDTYGIKIFLFTKKPTGYAYLNKLDH